MSHKRKNFKSKILLFGEYSLMIGSKALAAPYSLFSGNLKFHRKEAAPNIIDNELRSFCNYLKVLTNIEEFLHIDAFEFDISQGLLFESTIPQGYGLGSSGALTASVFNRYLKSSLKAQDISSLRDLFSRMESHFHGSSSGIDPLISYYEKPLLMHDKTHFDYVDLPNYLEGRGGLFLLNTGRARRTEPLVNLFIEKYNSNKFKQECEDYLIPLTNQCINLFLEKNTNDLILKFKQLSKFQYINFMPMIPTLFRDTWESGLEHNHYSLKLCGAGGGGFIIGITDDLHKAKNYLSNYEIRPVYLF